MPKLTGKGLHSQALVHGDSNRPWEALTVRERNAWRWTARALREGGFPPWGKRIRGKKSSESDGSSESGEGA